MADHENLKEGERRIVTILFSDMKGFTSLSERMDPEEIDALMNEVFGRFEGIIKKNGGMVEKFIGDALVAVFGAEDIHEDDASRAIHSSLEFLEAMHTHAQRLKTRGIDSSFRTGINTGLITTGKRGEFEVVTGHAMSVAQRLEAAASSDSILISESTREKCENEFEFSKKITLMVKGKKEPVTAYEVLGPAVGEMHDEGPCIGRKDILDGILKNYIRNSYEEVSGYFLSGEAGIGKTKAALAFLEKIRRFPDFTTPVLTARPQKYNTKPFTSIFEIIFEYFDLDPRTEHEAVLPLIEALPGIPKGTPEKFAKLIEGTGHGGLDAGIFTLFTVFDAILRRHVGDIFPILVFIDNAPSMDRQSREFFQYLFRNGKIKPFFLVTGREFTPGVKEAFSGIRAVKVPPFTQEEAREFVMASWPDAASHEKALETIIQSGMGNPLFLKEYVKYAKMNRDTSSLPLTVQNIFLATLDKYTQDRRELLRKLSVFQLSFTVEDARYIEAKTGGETENAKESLQFFLQEGILRKDGEFHFFRLDLFRKALYNSVLNYNKKIIHGHVADRLMAQKKPNPIRLITHLIRSERFAEAVDVMQADPTKNHNYDYGEYIDILLRHIGKKDSETMIKLLITKSALLFNSGKIRDAETVLRELMQLAISGKIDRCMGFVYHWICSYNNMIYSFQKAYFTGQKALYYYRKIGAPATSVQDVMRVMALSELFRNNRSASDRMLEETRRLPGLDHHLFNDWLAEYRLYSGDYQGAILAISENIGNVTDEEPIRLFLTYDIAAKVLWQLCDFEALAAAVKEMIKLGATSEALHSQAWAMLGTSLWFSGDKGGADDAFSQAEFYSGQVKNDYDKVDVLRTLALSYHNSGNLKKAEETALEGLVLGLRYSTFYPTFTLLTLLVEIYGEKGELENARFHLKEASFFCSTNLHMAYKDMIIYRYWSWKLSEHGCGGDDREALMALYGEELRRIRKTEQIANMNRTRSFGKIAEEFKKWLGEKAACPEEGQLCD